MPMFCLEKARQRQLLSACIPTAVAHAFAALSGIPRTLLDERTATLQDLAVHVVFTAWAAIPALCLLKGQQAYRGRWSAVGHLMASKSLLLMGCGWLPLIEPVRVVIQHRLEVLCELIVLFQCTLHPAAMLVLHLLKQLGWASVLHRSGVPAPAILKRCVHNYCLLMVVSCVLELRLWALSRQDKASARRLQAKQQPSAGNLTSPSPCSSQKGEAGPGQAAQGASDDVQPPPQPQQLPSAAVAASSAAGTDAQQRRLRTAYDSACSTCAETVAAVAAAHDCGEYETPTCRPAMNNAILLELLMATTHAWGDEQADGAIPSAAGNAGVIEAQPAAAHVLHAPASQLPMQPVSSGSSSAVLPAGTGTLGAVMAHARPAAPAGAHPVSAAADAAVTPVAAALVPAAVGSAAPATVPTRVQALAGVPSAAVPAGRPVWQRRRPRNPQTVYIKLKDMDVCDLPHDFQHCFKRQLRRCMPGLAVAGVAVRSGCVMLAIDLQALGHDSDVSNDTVLIETLSQAVAQMTAHVNVNSFTIQIEDTLYAIERSSASDPFHLSLSSPPTPVPAATLALALRSVAPVVHCVDSTQPLTANVKLQLPRGCHLLEQWVPPGLPHGSERGSAQPGGQAKLLVREARGDYLPVRVEVVCVEATDAMTTLHTVKVHIDLPSTSVLRPMGLSLELWYTPATAGMSTGPTELLAAHVPMLAFPHVGQDAASELAQIVPQLAGVPVLPDMGGDMHVDSARSSAEHRPSVCPWLSPVSCTQMWMVLPDNLLHVLAYIVAHNTPTALLATWQVAVRYHLDTIFSGLMCTSILMPTPLLVLFATRLVVAYFHSLAVEAAGVPHAFPRSLLVQSAAMATTVAYRLRQVHLYRRACAARRKVKEE